METRIGIIGTGVGIRTHLAGFRKTAGATVVGISGSSPDRARHFAQQHDIPKAYPDYAALCTDPDLDLICVASPNSHHFQHVAAATAAGKHVLAEKPLAMSMAEISQLQASTRRSDRLHVINHQLRFNPYIAQIKNLISEGSIGRIYLIQIHQQSAAFTDPTLPWSWSFEASQGGGVRLAMASHLIDLLYFWFPQMKPYHVLCHLDPVLKMKIDNFGVEHSVDVCSSFNIQLSTDIVQSISLSASAAAYGPSAFRIAIYGNLGEVQFDLTNKLRFSNQDNRGELNDVEVDGVQPGERENKVSIFSGSFTYFAPKLIRAIQNDEELLGAATFSDGADNQRLLEAALTSAQRGETVPLNKGYHSLAIF